MGPLSRTGDPGRSALQVLEVSAGRCEFGGRFQAFRRVEAIRKRPIEGEGQQVTGIGTTAQLEA